MAGPISQIHREAWTSSSYRPPAAATSITRTRSHGSRKLVALISFTEGPVYRGTCTDFPLFQRLDQSPAEPLLVAANVAGTRIRRSTDRRRAAEHQAGRPAR